VGRFKLDYFLFFLDHKKRQRSAITVRAALLPPSALSPTTEFPVVNREGSVFFFSPRNRKKDTFFVVFSFSLFSFSLSFALPRKITQNPLSLLSLSTKSIFRYTWDHVNNKSTTCPPPPPPPSSQQPRPPAPLLPPPSLPSSIITFSLTGITLPCCKRRWCVCLVWVFRFFFVLFLSAQIFIHRFLLTSPLPSSPPFFVYFHTNTITTQFTDACFFSLFNPHHPFSFSTFACSPF